MSDETPRPPSTPEFGFVVRGGPAHRYPASGPLRVAKLSVGPYDNNVYVLRAGDEAVVIDGAADADRILDETTDVRVTAVLQTHNHFDHVQALAALVREWRVPVYAHPADPPPVDFEAVGQSLTLGPVSIRAVHTPGHTSGSVCYIVEDFLFSGDTLFPGGPGKTTPETFPDVMRSLDELFALPDETRVCPGHGIDTRIGLERPHLGTWRRRGW